MILTNRVHVLRSDDEACHLLVHALFEKEFPQAFEAFAPYRNDAVLEQYDGIAFSGDAPSFAYELPSQRHAITIAAKFGLWAPDPAN